MFVLSRLPLREPQDRASAKWGLLLELLVTFITYPRVTQHKLFFKGHSLPLSNCPPKPLQLTLGESQTFLSITSSTSPLHLLNLSL